LPAPNWSRPLPRPIIIPDVMELETLADVRSLVEKHLPAEYRSKFTWRQLAGLLKLALATGASAAPVDASTPSAGVSRQVFLGEEEISDVSLATFYVFDKENAGSLKPGVQLARGGGGGCGCGHGCGGGGCRGCGGCRGFGGGCGGGCRVGFGFGGCGGCGCAGCGVGWWGIYGVRCAVGVGCCISWGGCRYC
jgi:hypothetical protein